MTYQWFLWEAISIRASVSPEERRTPTNMAATTRMPARMRNVADFMLSQVFVKLSDLDSCFLRIGDARTGDQGSAERSWLVRAIRPPRFDLELIRISTRK